MRREPLKCSAEIYVRMSVGTYTYIMTNVFSALNSKYITRVLGVQVCLCAYHILCTHLMFCVRCRFVKGSRPSPTGRRFLSCMSMVNSLVDLILSRWVAD